MAYVKLGTQLMVAKKMEGGGYTWTLPSLLGDMLQIAQDLFGERDRSYTVLGIEFGGTRPRVWCPGNRGDIVIQLAERCMEEPYRACYQLAHECIHLLGPSGCSGTNVLEEGLATYFAQYYMRERVGRPGWHSTMQNYTDAQKQVEILLNLDPNAIKTLRQEQPTFKLFTLELLTRHYPELPLDVAETLVSPFVYHIDTPKADADDKQNEKETA